MIETSVVLSFIGVALVAVGVVLVWNPELVSNKPINRAAYRNYAGWLSGKTMDKCGN